ncbi:hypothetical protein EK21DRAFT_113113 [Setomelanomma holmii]|uniref:Uncharacterized protein n=1 Tax=Setomelanomma holmii TaxID=210430 RepID=A0A9P4LMS7_9PLEO|nr:hypothetical protein EK21DRAFT_113113 [Setomelanomma holmii]
MRDSETFPDSHSITLHSSADQPDSLVWVLLFQGANPKWDSDGVIFVKSKLDLLPSLCSAPQIDLPDSLPTLPKSLGEGQHDVDEDGGVPLSTSNEDLSIQPGAQVSINPVAATQPKHSKFPQEGAPVDHSSIAIFAQKHRRLRSFKILGWHHISRLHLLEPRSTELVQMLQKKWETVNKYGKVQTRGRDADKWKSSMARRWAIVKFEKDEQATETLGEPNIKRLEDDEAQRGAGKSVNEMLAEMRLEGGI